MNDNVVTLIPESSESAAALERYNDAYGTCEVVLGFSGTVKLGGIFLGGVAVTAAMIVIQLFPEERGRVPPHYVYFHHLGTIGSLHLAGFKSHISCCGTDFEDDD